MHIFISYAREDSRIVAAIYEFLRAKGANVWLDKTSIIPGENWKSSIRNAVKSGAFFLYCCSTRSLDKERAYQNEELNIAIDELRLRPARTRWFIPIRLDDCELPDLQVNSNIALHDFQRIDLFDPFSDPLNELAVALNINEVDKNFAQSADALANSKPDRSILSMIFRYSAKLRRPHTHVSLVIADHKSEKLWKFDLKDSRDASLKLLSRSMVKRGGLFSLDQFESSEIYSYQGEFQLINNSLLLVLSSGASVVSARLEGFSVFLEEETYGETCRVVERTVANATFVCPYTKNEFHGAKVIDSFTYYIGPMYGLD